MKHLVLTVIFSVLLLVSCGAQPSSAMTTAPETETPETTAVVSEAPETTAPETTAAETEQTVSPEVAEIRSLSREEQIEKIQELLTEEMWGKYSITTHGIFRYPSSNTQYIAISCLTQEDADALDEYILSLGFDHNAFELYVLPYANPV